MLKLTTMVTTSLKQQLNSVPKAPGIYLFKDNKGSVLYVGKSSNLKNRMKSYFGNKNHSEYKLRKLSENVKDFEIIVTGSDTEALILENTFIKTLMPRYNARLKDSKTYPYLRIGTNENFPQVSITRSVKDDGARYFGPYASPGSVRKTMNLIKRLFPYRSCTKEITGFDERPCLEYYINRCVAPCTGYSTKEEYNKIIDEVILILEGKTRKVITDLKARMSIASKTLEFEKAGLLRDQIKAIQRVTERQKVVSLKDENQDVIAIAKDEDNTLVEIFFIRGGSLIGREHFVMTGTIYDDPNQIVSDFTKQYYASASNIPNRILLQHSLNDHELIKRWLGEKRGRKIAIQVPKRGKNLQLIKMAYENASRELEHTRTRLSNNKKIYHDAIAELQENLNLPHLPRRIECYDISNIQGTTPVGSMIVFKDGKPENRDYRRFYIKNTEGPNDYQMMKEVLERRFTRLSNASIQSENDYSHTRSFEKSNAWSVVPDLVLIDGGRGHLNIALQVLLELGLSNIPLASLAKENEEIFVTGTSDPIVLARDSVALFLVQRARDEAHRFAITYHRKTRAKKAIKSALDSVRGIGPKRKRNLLRHFGSLRLIKQATIDEISLVPGMNKSLAYKLKGL